MSTIPTALEDIEVGMFNRHLISFLNNPGKVGLRIVTLGINYYIFDFSEDRQADYTIWNLPKFIVDSFVKQNPLIILERDDEC